MLAAKAGSTQCCAQLRSTKNVQCSKNRRLQTLTCTSHKNLEQFIRSQLSPKELKRVLNGVQWMAPMRHEQDFIVDDSYVDSASESDESEDESENDEDSDASSSLSSIDDEIAGLAHHLAGVELAPGGSSQTRTTRSSTRLTPESLRSARDAIVAKAAGGPGGALSPASSSRAVQSEMLPPSGSSPHHHHHCHPDEPAIGGALPVSPAESLYPKFMSLQSSPRGSLGLSTSPSPPPVSPTDTVHPGLMSLQSSPRSYSRQSSSPRQLPTPLATPLPAPSADAAGSARRRPTVKLLPGTPLSRQLAPPLQMSLPPSAAKPAGSARRPKVALPSYKPAVAFFQPHERLGRN